MISDREKDELIGLCRGVLADGVVTQEECEFLLDWLHRNSTNLDQYPFNILRRRLEEVLEDGVLDSDEEFEMLDLLVSIVGTPVKDSRSSSPAMPYNSNGVESIEGLRICLTGEFKLGPRSEIVSIIETHGASFSKGVTKKVDVLFIGSIGNDAWKHSSFGRKIEKALAYADEGVPIKVLGEEHLTPHIKE